MKAAIVQFTQEALVDLLQLPAGARISRVWVDNEEHNGPIRFRVEGAGFECGEGMRIETAHPIVRKTWSATTPYAPNPTIDWRFPESGNSQEGTDSVRVNGPMIHSQEWFDALVSGETG